VGWESGQRAGEAGMTFWDEVLNILLGDIFASLLLILAGG
jgi:hypothetical protein